MKTITAHKTVAGLIASGLLAASASAAVPTNPAIYYNANQASQQTSGGVPLFRDLNDPANPAGTTEIGDEITFGGSLRNLTDLQYNFNITPGSNPSAQLFLRSLDGPLFNGNASPGSVLYTGDIVSLGSGADAFGYGSVTVNGIDGRVLPDTVAWSVVFTGVNAGERAGLLYYNPPEVGSSTDDFWARVNGTWQLLDTPGVVDNFAFAAYAVPEPTTWAIMLGGLGLLGFLRRRKA
jgi:hypothetical protein